MTGTDTPTESNGAARLRAWRTAAAANRPGYDHLADVSYESAPVGDADVDEVLRELDDAKGAAALWEDTAMKLKDRAAVLNKRIRDDAEGLAIVADRYRAQIAETGRLRAEVERLTRERDQAGDGDEAVSHEWATRAPDGTRTRHEDEDWARRTARLHPHLELDRREIRHFVGRWKAAPAAEESR